MFLDEYSEHALNPSSGVHELPCHQAMTFPLWGKSESCFCECMIMPSSGAAGKPNHRSASVKTFRGTTANIQPDSEYCRGRGTSLVH